MNPQGQPIHDMHEHLFMKEEGLFHILPLNPLRKTNKVDFHYVPDFCHFNGMDRVIHKAWAKSPWPVWDESEVWYMHHWQEDNLMTLDGVRHVELYTPKHGKIERFEISADWIKRDGEIIYEGPALLGWPSEVFHRNYSEQWSSSINLAVRNSKFDVDHEFNIYSLKIDTWESCVVREWKLDQQFSKENQK